MSFGDSGSKQNHELCHQCLKPMMGTKIGKIQPAGFGQAERQGLIQAFKPMMGTKIGKIQPAGFGQAERQGLIQACINFECFIGQKNLAK